jgi:catalase
MVDSSNHGASDATLTTRQGHPVWDNQNQRTVGPRGPATLENYQYIEKLSHFDRERVPERVVHARGCTAFGYFETFGKWGDEPISKFTRAKVFQGAGKHTDVAARFSTVAGGRDSSEVARDPRGFAVKFYTEDGNWDLVGNNLGVFFIRDAIKFPDLIHSQKPDPVTFRQEANRVFDFFSQTPESLSTLTLVFSPRGIPANYRQMQGFGVNTYRWINEAGDTVLVKYHWIPKQGLASLTAEDAAAIQAHELGSATRDLFDAVGRGDFPEWEMRVQMMSDDDHPELDFDPLDDTMVWPEDQFPPKPVGRMVLNRMPSNFFLESEQIGFGTGVLVDGLDFSEDKMLIGRTFSYSDTQRYRIGPNYLQLPVNQPKTARVATNQRDGQMAYYQDSGGENAHINYEPSILGGLREAPDPTNADHGPVFTGQLIRRKLLRTNDYKQTGERFLLQEPWEREDLVSNLIGALKQCDRAIQERMVWHFFLAEDEYGKRVGQGLGITPEDVAHLGPVPHQVLNEEEKQRLKNLGHNGPREVEGMCMTHCVHNERAKVESMM